MFKTFSLVPIEYTYPEILAIQRLNIIFDHKQFKYSGLNSEYPFDRIFEYFRLTTSNTEEDCVIYAQIILRMVKFVGNFKETDSCILIIRLTTPSDEFEIPRFHHDGVFFHPKNGKIIQEKFVLSIRGAGTILSEPNELTRERVFEIFNNRDIDSEEISVRKELAKIIGEQIYQPTNNQGVFMKIFEYNPENNQFDFSNSAIHSEPNITQPRLFISIVPGSADQINETTKAKWNTKI